MATRAERHAHLPLTAGTVPPSARFPTLRLHPTPQALTQGPRPIEMQAGDTRRYVGDMLAWLHAALELEAEFLGSLFGDGEAAAGNAAGAGNDAAAGAAGQASGDREAAGGAPEATGAAATTDGTVPTLRRVLDKVFGSTCRPLKVGKPGERRCWGCCWVPSPGCPGDGKA